MKVSGKTFDRRNSKRSKYISFDVVSVDKEHARIIKYSSFLLSATTYQTLLSDEMKVFERQQLKLNNDVPQKGTELLSNPNCSQILSDVFEQRGFSGNFEKRKLKYPNRQEISARKFF